VKTVSITDTLATVADKAALGEAVLALVRDTGLLKVRKRRARAAVDSAPKRKRNRARTFNGRGEANALSADE